MLPLFQTSVANAVAPSLPSALSFVASVFLFRYCLHTLTTGSPPDSASSISGDPTKGRFEITERQQAAKPEKQERKRGAS